ncbi:MAG TPA: metallophosphoesterase [Vicinamibacterales bacterium]|nr:metallophosphoesterase [Vicinamibacterales bacterium]
MSRSYRSACVLVLALALSSVYAHGQVAPPRQEDSLCFAILGDAGTGGSAQRRIAGQAAAAHGPFPFEFVLMLGDNLYGDEDPDDYARKFEQPYKPLLDAGVEFYAALGNHDEPAQRFYKLFNMKGERYYTFKKDSVRFFALDSNYMDRAQLQWLEKALREDDADWKIAYFHHPLYSSGERHGSDEVLREQLEPLFVEHGVDVVFTGHEHFYERIKPQKGIAYFISGNAAKLRRGNIGQSTITAKGYDQGYTFMLIEIAGDELHFQAVTDKGQVVDSGVIHRQKRESSILF